MCTGRHACACTLQQHRSCSGREPESIMQPGAEMRQAGSPTNKLCMMHGGHGTHTAHTQAAGRDASFSACMVLSATGSAAPARQEYAGPLMRASLAAPGGTRAARVGRRARGEAGTRSKDRRTGAVHVRHAAQQLPRQRLGQALVQAARRVAQHVAQVRQAQLQHQRARAALARAAGSWHPMHPITPCTPCTLIGRIAQVRRAQLQHQRARAALLRAAGSWHPMHPMHPMHSDGNGCPGPPGTAPAPACARCPAARGGILAPHAPHAPLCTPMHSGGDRSPLPPGIAPAPACARRPGACSTSPPLLGGSGGT